MRIFQTQALNRIHRVRFIPDTSILVVLVWQESTVLHLTIADGNTETWTSSLFSPSEDIAYSTDGRVMAVSVLDWSVRAYTRVENVDGAETANPSRSIRYYHLESFQETVTDWFIYAPRSVAFAPTTDPLHAWLGVTGQKLTLWNQYTKEQIVTPEEGNYRGVAFGPDGTTVTSIEYHAHAICVWNVKPFRVLFYTDLKGINTFGNGSVAMMPDGERVIVAAGTLVRCVPINGGKGWDTVTRKPPLEITLHPTGRTLLVADGSRRVTAYDTDNGQASAQYDWGIGRVGCVTYSPDGTLAAAGGEKGQVVVWDAE